MIAILDLGLKLAIWFLLTADLSGPNVAIGLAIALLLPGQNSIVPHLTPWLHLLGEFLVAIPQAYGEAIEMIFRPHLYEEVTLERVKPDRTPGLIFLDIFLITFTPKTIVLQYQEDGWFKVHRLTRRKPR